ncbi:hypothetical protein SDC9_150776 [bioreactor metagenome]|uniref:Uncharacterized protein n=1 Tax=bioreactor metagenome TaxID=1076179 RepID=A0A645EQ25_9ZZZZ
MIRIDSLVDKSALADLLDIFKSRQLTVTDFRLSDYDSEYKDEDFTVSRETQTETPKSQLELFKEKELGKIKGDNLGADQKIQNYDISKLFHTVILAVIGIVLLLSIQLYVGRKLDVRKIFKK